LSHAMGSMPLLASALSQLRWSGCNTVVLGILEAATLPSVMLINVMWYLSDGQPLSTALWHNTFAGVFGGILSYGIGKIGGSLLTWKVRLPLDSIQRSSSWHVSQYIFLIYSTFNLLFSNAIHHWIAHPTRIAHFVADLPLHLNITTPQQAI
jgi:hypothetical protein